nr:MAG TPA: hypothetical protein [Caudoviricetes sp.]
MIRVSITLANLCYNSQNIEILITNSYNSYFFSYIDS